MRVKSNHDAVLNPPCNLLLARLPVPVILNALTADSYLLVAQILPRTNCLRFRVRNNQPCNPVNLILQEVGHCNSSNTTAQHPTVSRLLPKQLHNGASPAQQPNSAPKTSCKACGLGGVTDWRVSERNSITKAHKLIVLLIPLVAVYVASLP